MVSNEMLQLGTNPSAIRDLFEYGNRRKVEIGAENVFDFSIGNPSVPAPDCVKEAVQELLEEDAVALHGYTSAVGDLALRQKLAAYVNETQGTSLSAGNFYITAGAAASLTISLKALAEAGDEFIVFAPFFPEYRVFVEMTGSRLVVVQCDTKDFQIDLETFEKAVTPNTKGVIVNSPNNPTGVVITAECIEKMCTILKNKQEEYGKEIFLIADEPYRELVYDDVDVPYLMNYYDNTIVCYSYSKSLSLPGERIGYIAVSDRAKDWNLIYASICGAGRALGYVCAPSLFQQVISRCIGQTSDVNVYKKNRDLLYEALTGYGYRCIKPDGAFYLFVEALEPDAAAFAEKAKEFELLLVASDSFGTSGFVRISYCVSTAQIEAALPAFQKLAEAYHE